MSAPVGGIITNIPPTEIDSSALTDAYNMVYRDNRIDKKLGYSQLGAGLPLNGSVMAIKRYIKFSGVEKLVVITSRDVYDYYSGNYSLLTPGYITNTVTVTNGSPIITGATTLWSANVKIGDKFRIGTINAASPVWYTVLTVDSNTQITLTAPYAGVSGNTLAYTIRKVYTVPDSSFVSLETMLDLLIWTNGTDPIQKWDGSAAVQNLGGSPPLAQYIKSFKDYLILASTVESTVAYPQRIRWSDTGAPEVWNSGNAGFNSLAEGPDFITGMEILRDDYLVIYKENSIYVAVNTTNINVFDISLRVVGIGLIAPRTLQAVTIAGLGDVHVFLGADNVYAYSGATSPVPIADSIQRQMLSLINPAEVTRAFSAYIKEDNEYWLFFPSTTSTYVNQAWVFNTKTKAWLKASFADFLTCVGDYVTQSNITWDTWPGTWDDQTGIWDDRRFNALSPIKLFGDKDGYVYKNDFSLNEDGEAINGYFDTKDFVGDLALTSQIDVLQREVSGASTTGSPLFNIMKEFVQMDVYAKGGTLAVYYSTDEGLNWIPVLPVLTLSSTEYTRNKIDLRVNCEKIRFRFQNNTISETFSFRNYTLYFIPRGRI